MLPVRAPEGLASADANGNRPPMLGLVARDRLRSDDEGLAEDR
jgi:hypothetical protein